MQVIKEKDHNYSRILKSINRRFYRTPKGYNSYDGFLKYVANFIYRSCKGSGIWDSEQLQQTVIPKEENPIDYFLDIMLLQYGSVFRPPVFTIKEELVESFYNTKPLPSWNSLHLFAPSGLILFPLNNCFNLRYLLFSQYKGRDEELYCFGLFNDESYQGFYLPTTNENVETNAKYERSMQFDAKDVVRKSRITPLGNPRLNSLLLNIILYKQMYEEKELSYSAKVMSGLISPEKKHPVMGYSPRNLTPIVIGQDYKLKRENIGMGGTHASPQTHWRSGHWRNQVIGERKNPDHKLLWIEPVLVNGQQPT